MGVPARIALYAPSAELARAAAERAFARIAALEDVLSDYRVDSEVARLAASADGTPRALSPELVSILASAQRVHAASGGAFDPTLGASTHLWRAARDARRMPSADEWAAARARGGFERLAFDRERGTASPSAGLVLDFGGIAKGAAAQAALDELRAAGCERALVALAGDVACGRAPPDRRGWRITVALGLPGLATRTLELENACVSTSGDREQALELDGVRHSHLIDPRSGRPLTRRTACSIVVPIDAAEDAGALADALASAACGVGLDSIGALLAQFPAARALAAELRDGALVERELPSAR